MKSNISWIRIAGMIVTIAVLMALVPIHAEGKSLPPSGLHDLRSSLQLASEAQNYWALVQRVQENGHVRVIVTLNTPFTPEGELSVPAAVQAQRTGIAKAQEAITRRLESFNANILRRFKYVPVMVVVVDPEGLADLLDNPDVAHIQEDEPVPPSLSESIPIIGADQAWSMGYTGSGQTIAILDTGVESSHSFFEGRVVTEACFSTTDGGYGSTTLCPNGLEEQIGAGAGANCSGVDGCDHGTHVAGIAAGSRVEFSGVAPDANIISVQVFSRFDNDTYCGAGKSPCVLSFSSDQIRALEWVYEQRTNFNIASVNMSLGGGQYTSNCDSNSRKLYIDNLRSVDIATVIASGNDGYRDALNAPACISSAISVGATSNTDSVKYFSNVASFLSLLAPGDGIWSSVPGDIFDHKSGTSMAAPHVAGAWAVLKSKVPNASVDEVLAALQDTGVLIDDLRSGGVITDMRRIQVDSALSALDASTPTPTSTATYTSTSTATSTGTPTPVETPTPSNTPSITPTTSCDSGFGTGGLTITSIGSGIDRGTSMAIQPDGKIVMAGFSDTGSNWDFAVVRYNPDGTLDTSFGAGGIVTTPIGGDNDLAWAVAIQPDGKIVVGGEMRTSSGGRIAIVRYHPDGTLDTSFDGDGKVITDVGDSNDSVGAIAFQPDGKIIIVGNTRDNLNTDMVAARYNADGSLDASFDGDGIVTLSFGSGGDYGGDVVVQPDGKILVAGTGGVVGGADFAVARLKSNGSLDSSFGTEGKVTIPIYAGTDQGTALALQPDDKIIVAGYSHNGNDHDFALIRLDSHGTLDSSFDSDGKAITPIGSGWDTAYAVAIQSDGKIISAGSSATTSTNHEFAVVRYNTDGSLDSTFGADGIVVTPYGSEHDKGAAVTIQPDGKIVVGGSVTSGGILDFAVLRYNTDGSLDDGSCEPTVTPTTIVTETPTPTPSEAPTVTPTEGCSPGFGTGGLVTTSFGFNDRGEGIVIQPDGKIVVAGYGSNDDGTNLDLVVIRYNPDGSLDSSFNGDGIARTAIGSGNDYGHAVALQSDGKIVAAGTSWDGEDYDFTVLRYSPDGDLDTSFDGDGIVTTQISTFTDTVYGVIVQPDGKIIAAGVYWSGWWDIAVVRYNIDGSLDTSFGSDGIVTTSVTSGHDNGESVALQSDGKIVVAGYGNEEFIVLRYRDNGNLDNSFGSGGIVTTSVGIGARGHSVSIQPDGKIVVAGYTNNGSDRDIAVLRYNSNGNLDSSFDGDGKAVISIGYERDIARSCAIQPDGKIVVTGLTQIGISPSTQEIAVVRLASDGSLDSSFDGDGIAVMPYGDQDDRGYGVAIQPDGKIVVTGYVHNGNEMDIVVLRYLSDGSLDVGTCVPTATPTVVHTDTATATQTAPNTSTPTPTLTATPTPLPTNSPTPTPSPTNTPIGMPTDTPTSTGCILEYSITDLGTLGGDRSFAYDINDSGQIVGEAKTTDGDWHAFLWESGAMTDLGTLGGYTSYAKSINNLGQIVGSAQTITGHDRAFLWESGSMVDIGTLGGSEAYAEGINDVGKIVGASVTAGGDYHGFLWESGSMIDLGTLGSDWSWPYDVNNSAQVVGESFTSDWDLHAFFYDSGIMEDLGALDGDFSIAEDINNSGQIVGYSNTASGDYRGFLSEGGVMTGLNTLGGSDSTAYGVNDLGQIVGSAKTVSEDSRAALWQLGGITDLNDRIIDNPGYIFTGAEAINNSGYILAHSWVDGNLRAFLLTPLLCPTPTVTPTPTHTSTPTPTPTIASTNTSTPTATSTPTMAAADTLTPTSSPSPATWEIYLPIILRNYP